MLISNTFNYVDEEKMDDNLICNTICFKPLINHLKSNNIFTESCIHQLQYICQICSSIKNNIEKRKEEFQTIIIILNQLDKLKLKCNNEMFRSDFENHLKSCFISCSAYDVSCKIIMTKTDLETHINNCELFQSKKYQQEINSMKEKTNKIWDLQYLNIKDIDTKKKEV